MPDHVRYILHDDDGNILQWGECGEELLEMQTRDGLRLKRHRWGDDIAARKVDRIGRVIKRKRRSRESSGDHQ